MPIIPTGWRSPWKPARALALGALGGALLITAEALTPAAPRRSLAQTAPNCPLPVSVAVTFLNSTCTRTVLSQPTTFFRYHSNDGNRYGRYLTTDRLTVNTDVIRSLALNQEWGNQASKSLTVTLPAGTVVYQGVVAPQTPATCYPGGGQQVFIENSKDPQIVWAEAHPMTVQPFSCP